MAVTLPFRQLEPFGVEVMRNLAEPFGPSEAYHFTELFRRYGIILARGQALSMARQREICALLGPVLDRAGETGTMSNAERGASATELAWHSDAAYTEHPFDALSLHALDVVDDASSTRFINAEMACDALPRPLAEALEGCEQEMISPHYARLGSRTCDEREPEAMKRGVRPALFKNPHNGRLCVWVNELQSARLLGMEWEESRDLLRAVFDEIYAPARVLEHRWRRGDVIFWDNIALQHARPNVESVGPRVLQRVIVGTEGVAPHVI
jgi:taurine dioxygenase